MKQKKQILFLTKLFPPHVGGVEKHVLNLADHLIKKNFSVTIVTEQYKKNIPLHEEMKNLKIYRIPVPKNLYLKKFYIWKWFLLNMNILLESDIIHVHDVFYWILPFKIFIPKKKIFMTFHGYEGFPVKKSWIVLRKIAETLTDGNICVGNFMKKWYGTKPTFVIYGAAEIKKPKNEDFRRKSMIFFGRLDEQTNVLEYAKGFGKIFQKDQHFSMDIYGDGKLKNKIKRPIELYPFKENVSDILHNYEYIFVSRYLSMLESLLSKRLVFAYYDNAIKKDYLLDSPFKKYVVTVSSVDELVEKVHYYEKNIAKKKKIIAEGYQFASKQTWDNLVNIYLKLWSS